MRLPQRERQVVAVAEIAHGRDPGAQLCGGGVGHRGQRGGVIAGCEGPGGVEAGVEREVHVRVDQSRKQCRSRQLDESGVRG